MRKIFKYLAFFLDNKFGSIQDEVEQIFREETPKQETPKVTIIGYKTPKKKTFREFLDTTIQKAEIIELE